MTSASSESLDSQELLHLALYDIQHGLHDGAISKLKQAILLDGNNPQIHFMLAAEHAEIGLLDRAIDGMTQALTLDPALRIARFQLGLLYFSQDKLESARETWEALDDLNQDDVLSLFKAGLLLIGEGDRKGAVPKLERALEVDTINAPLRRDIERVLKYNHEQISAQAEPESDVAHAFARRYDDVGSDS